MPIAWNGDPPGSLAAIGANVADLGPALLAQARARVDPVAGLAQAWHRAIYRGVPLPAPCYAGEFRDTDPRFPQLVGYEVSVGGLPGVPSSDVPDEVATFEQAMRSVAATLDAAIPSGQVPASGPELAAVITFAASAHGEWIRIHPFANGNGRTARCWANLVALRYGLPAFVAIQPRPGDLVYAQAARASMRGDHSATDGLFRGMLRQVVGP